ncbi:probable RNA helicase armi [Drosophila bipectinata]|uniref:probable RNA helicase armi n=1 Tax=Drosophila bipectinata TaxID=42026 RepID=UPI001C8A2936|nr:probable RNA helicase armi [Drosophila bipectinata]XP_043068358.1 probable RNA helicase armi [Drosophila bipectinata]
MLAFVRGLFLDMDRQRDKSLELLAEENNFLDQEIIKEDMMKRIEEEVATGHQEDGSAGIAEDDLGSDLSKLSLNDKSCSSRKGVITRLSIGGGLIDHILEFSIKAAESIYHELHLGSKVEYLTYRKVPKGPETVIKIIKIVEQVWDDVNDTEIKESVASLRTEKPTYFNTQMRNVLGLVTKRLEETIEVETEYGEEVIELAQVELTFEPRGGDRVCLQCDVQLDDGFVDKQGEILQVIRVFPARVEPSQKCIVERVYTDLAVLGSNYYVMREDIPGAELHLGDIVMADLIECQYGKFVKRAIKVVLQEKNFGVLKGQRMCSSETVNEVQPVTISGPDRHITTEMWQKQRFTLKLKNNINRMLRLTNITVFNGPDSQLTVIEPKEVVDVVNGGHISVVLEVESKFMGEATERFTFHFERFKVTRCFTVIVCASEEEATRASRRLTAADTLAAPGRTVGQRSRYYANQVWSKKGEVVPGEGIATKRRFVAIRLGYFEVPEKLRLLYLTTERRMEMLESIETNYPYIKEPLNMVNYIQRFSLLLHLEEIVYFINFRNYDRDRAHFQRDTDFLSLQIENLAERRPSLVVGDVVRAVNPWGDSESGDKKTFEGIIHKVLFNRVLLKFNNSFHQKYNGEDYRLEFFFSRFGFRKQHYAVSRIVTQLGEEFLFPKRIHMRTNPQLEVRMEGEDMYLFDSPVPWYNASLNCIQKRAVFNILRGEALHVPYVIFGPPGTGKTVTLVETILQLVRNVPGSRLLVGTPSNSSADLLTKRIIESNALRPGDFIRLVSQNQIEKDLIAPELMNYCATVDIGSIGTCNDSMMVTESGLKLRCQMKFMGNHKVTISTCTTLGNFLQMGFEPAHFTHVLIDEAGQCTEPETMIPNVLLVKGHGQTILAGDPHQLQAIVINHYAAQMGLSKSYLERLLESEPYRKNLQLYRETSGYNPLVLTKLLYNYRALPSIMSIYSKLFYDNELVAMVDEKNSREAKQLAGLLKVFEPNVDMPKSHGTYFYGITGENMQESDSPSWYNPAEARELFLMTIALYRCNVTTDQIGIMTPYVKQVKTIRTLFMGTNVAMPKVGSVEEFQGQERDIMLISTVRSTESILRADYRLCLGFVRCNKRMNVAISRARTLMIIFGNPHLLSVDDNWRTLIVFCANNNAYFGCELPPNIHDTDEEDDAMKDTFGCVP